MVCYPIRTAALEDNDVTQHYARILTACAILKVWCFSGGEVGDHALWAIAPYFL